MKKLFLGAALILAAMTANATTWTFSAASTFSTTGNIVEQVASNGLFTLSTKCSIDGSSKTFASGSYTFRFKTGGTGEAKQSNCLAFVVTGNSDISIDALASSGTATRKMEIATADGTIVGSNLVPGTSPTASTAAYTYSYTGAATTLYVYSASSTEGDATYTAGGLNIYSVTATNVNETATTADIAIKPSSSAVSNASANKSGIELKGDVLVNDGNLNVTVFNMAGAKVISSSAASINVSSLKGSFVAVTANGSYKFAK